MIWLLGARGAPKLTVLLSISRRKRECQLAMARGGAGHNGLNVPTMEPMPTPHFSRRFTLLLVSLVFAASCAPSQAVDKPNILFILVDDLGTEWISSYGADDIQTPAIDRLAAGGM